MKDLALLLFKGTQALNLFFDFFAETETLWSQGHVTRDFSFCVSSACDEIVSVHAQPAFGCSCKNCRNLNAGLSYAKIRSVYAQCAMKSFLPMLSV